MLVDLIEGVLLLIKSCFVVRPLSVITSWSSLDCLVINCSVLLTDSAYPPRNRLFLIDLFIRTEPVSIDFVSTGFESATFVFSGSVVAVRVGGLSVSCSL